MAKKADHKTDRKLISRFDQIINIGSAMTDDFERLGLKSPQDLIGNDAVMLYQKICKVSRTFHDPCVLDTYMATIDYMNGNAPQAWWKFTKERKKNFTPVVDKMRKLYLR